ncbi:MAG: penicillin acylase family protein [Bradymonadales bacterium]|nr:penicillin acylase family protein [Bradymonadales bacterium]
MSVCRVLFRVLLGAWLLALPGCSDDDQPPIDGDLSDSEVADLQPDVEEPDTPPPDDFRIPGLSGEVTVMVDQYGIPHVQCQELLDCYAAQGYVMASNRFYQMDLLRHLIRGRLARFMGILALDSDRTMRPYMSTPQGQPLEELLWEQADSDVRDVLQAFGSGVNAWLADQRAGLNGATLSEEYNFPLLDGANIPDWEVLDSMACALYMLNDLSDDSEVDILRGEAFAALPLDLALDLLPLKPASDSTIVEASDGQVPLHRAIPTQRLQQAHQRLRQALPALRKARAALEPLHLFSLDGDHGSNNWVVGSDLTSGGNTLLANDPHLGLGNPPALFLNAIHVAVGTPDEMNLLGASLPGAPGILIGTNEHITWGVTTAYYDLADVYVEQLTGTGGVLFEGGVVDLVTVDHTFQVQDDEPVVETLTWVPHHGPLVAVDEETSTGISVRWVGHGGSTDLAAFLDLNQATTVAEAATALQASTVNNQCFVIADTAGTIAWYARATLPERPWASQQLGPWLPLPGDGSAEWAGWLDMNDLPSLVDPPAGFIATANNAMTDALLDGDPTNDGYPVLQTFMGPGFRHQRIVELLEEGGDQHSVETMLAIQSDTHSLLGERLVPFLFDATAASTSGLTDGGAAVATALESWESTCPTGLADSDPEGAPVGDTAIVSESAGCTAFHVTLVNLLEAAFGDELAQAGITSNRVTTNYLVRALLNALEQPESMQSGVALWDDLSTTDQVENRDQILVAALNQAAEFLTTTLGASAEHWLWGRIHTLTLRSDLFDTAGMPLFNYGPFANDGGIYTVDVAEPVGTDGNYFYRHGAVLRMVTEISGEGVEVRMQFAGGNDLHRSSELYNNLLPRYLRNEPVILALDPSEVAEQAARTFAIRPE